MNINTISVILYFRFIAKLFARFTLFAEKKKSAYTAICKIAIPETRKGACMIIALLNQKGGVGKTTLAVHVSTAWAQQGNKVLLVDADPQGSALDWSASRETDSLVPVVGLPTKNLHREIQAHIPNYHHIVIDGPPRVNELARAAIIAADLVLIPVQPSPYDVWAAKEIVDLITEARIYKEKLKSVFVINRKIVNTAIGRDVAEALEGYDLPVLAAAICQRVAFAESAARGSTVLEEEPRSVASQEITNVLAEIMTDYA